MLKNWRKKREENIQSEQERDQLIKRFFGNDMWFQSMSRSEQDYALSSELSKEAKRNDLYEEIRTKNAEAQEQEAAKIRQELEASFIKLRSRVTSEYMQKKHVPMNELDHMAMGQIAFSELLEQYENKPFYQSKLDLYISIARELQDGMIGGDLSGYGDAGDKFAKKARRER